MPNQTIQSLKNIQLKSPFERHVHDGISKLCKIFLVLYGAGNMFLSMYYPSAMKWFAIFGFIGTFFPQCIDIIIPDVNTTTTT